MEKSLKIGGDELKVLDYVSSTWLTYGQKVTPAAVMLESGVAREKVNGILASLSRRKLLGHEEDIGEDITFPIYSVTEKGLETLALIKNQRRGRDAETAAAELHRRKMLSQGAPKSTT